MSVSRDLPLINDHFSRLEKLSAQAEESEKEWAASFLKELCSNIGSVSFSQTTLEAMKRSLQKVKGQPQLSSTTHPIVAIATTLLSLTRQHEEVAHFAAAKARALQAKTSLQQNCVFDEKKCLPIDELFKKLKKDIDYESYRLQDHIDKLNTRALALEAEDKKNVAEITATWDAVRKMENAIKETVRLQEAFVAEFDAYRKKAGLKDDPKTPSLYLLPYDEANSSTSTDTHVKDAESALTALHAIRKRIQELRSELPLTNGGKPAKEGTHPVYLFPDTVFKVAESHPEIIAFELCGLLGAADAITPLTQVAVKANQKNQSGFVQPRIKNGFEAVIFNNRPDLGNILHSKLDLQDCQLKVLIQILLAAWDLHPNNAIVAPKETTEYQAQSQKTWEYQQPDGTWIKVDSFYDLLLLKMDNTLVTSNTKVRNNSEKSSERRICDDEELKKALDVKWQFHFFDNARTMGFERKQLNVHPNYLAKAKEFGPVTFPTRLFPLGLPFSKQPLTQEIIQFIAALGEKKPFIEKALDSPRFAHVSRREKKAFIHRIEESVRHLKRAETGYSGKEAPFQPTLMSLHHDLFPVGMQFFSLLARLENIRALFETADGIAVIKAKIDKKKAAYISLMQREPDKTADVMLQLATWDSISSLLDAITKFVNNTHKIIPPKNFPYEKWGVQQAKELKEVVASCIEFMEQSKIPDDMKAKKSILQEYIHLIDTQYLQGPFSQMDHHKFLKEVREAAKMIYDQVETHNLAYLLKFFPVQETPECLQICRDRLYLERCISPFLGSGYGYTQESAETILMQAEMLGLISAEKNPLVHSMLHEQLRKATSPAAAVQAS